MRILISGATGLIGGQLVKQCLDGDISVHYLTTRREALESRQDYRGFLWNPSRAEIDIKCFEGVSAIINLAGANIGKRWTSSRKKRILTSRLESLQTLAEGLRRRKDHEVTSLVSASAVGIYPDSQSALYEEDESAIADGFLGDVCRRWEEEADRLSQEGLQVSKIRTGLVLATEGGALPQIARPVRYGMGAAFGSGEQWQSWIHVEDLARMYLFLAQKQVADVFNGVAPNPITNNKLLKEIGRILKKPLFLPNIPAFTLKLVLGEMADMLLSSQRVSSKKIENAGFHFQYPNICLALEQLYPIKD